MTTVPESLIKVRPHNISHVTFIVGALYKMTNQNKLENGVEKYPLSRLRSHVRSTFIIAARKKVCCCTPKRAAANYQLYSQITKQRASWVTGTSTGPFEICCFETMFSIFIRFSIWFPICRITYLIIGLTSFLELCLIFLSSFMFC